MIHYFHGLFGHPTQWTPYLDLAPAKAHDLFDLENFFPDENDVLVGYSLGGRIALKLAVEHGFRLRKLILLSAHPGLRAEERADRRRWENQRLDKMKTTPQEKFMAKWNQQELFLKSTPVLPDAQTYERSIEIFDRYRLSEQQDYTPFLSEHRERVLYGAGVFDEKYLAIARSLEQRGLRVRLFQTDHRLLSATEDLRDFLSQEIR